MAIQYGDGTTSNTGRIIRVERAVYDTTTSMSISTTWNDVPGLSVTITPESTSSKFIISGEVNGEHSDATVNWNSAATIGYTVGGTTTWIEPASAGSRIRGMTIPKLSYYNNDNTSTPEGFGFASYWFSPGTTSAVTFRFGMQCYGSGRTFYINRTGSDTNTAEYERFRSWISVMEVAG